MTPPLTTDPKSTIKISHFTQSKKAGHASSRLRKTTHHVSALQQPPAAAFQVPSIPSSLHDTGSAAFPLENPRMDLDLVDDGDFMPVDEYQGEHSYHVATNQAEQSVEHPDVRVHNAVEPDAPKTPKSYWQSWLLFRQRFLDKLLATDGLGSLTSQSLCNGCSIAFSHTKIMYRCISCFNELSFCSDCMLSKHQEHLYHRIEKLTSPGYWSKSSLYSIGQVVSLHRNMGEECPRRAATRIMTIIHSNGFHKIKFEFCGCRPDYDSLQFYSQLMERRLYPASPKSPATAFTFDVLDLFVELSSYGRTSLHSFYLTLISLTDNAHLDDWHKRYDEFGHVVREWRHLLMLKRAGRGHDPKGITATEPGELAIECIACPIPGVNLPVDWKHAPKSDSFLYALYIGLDASFRLYRLNKGKKRDRELGLGWAYFSDPKPREEAVAIAQKNPPPVEKSNCESTHSAIEKQSAANEKRRDETGVAGVVCTRHGMIRPLGLTDLQYGERYVNMDFVFLCALHTVLLAISIFVTYDIACQWSRNLNKRLYMFPPYLTEFMRNRDIHFGIPKFHLPAHGANCRSTFSLNFLRGWARVDGEGIERVWSFLNGFAGATREMTSDGRHDLLDFQANSSNFRKIVHMGESALKKYRDAADEAPLHDEAFDQMRAACPANKVAEWDQLIDAWLKDTSVDLDPYREETAMSPLTINIVKSELLAQERGEAEAVHFASGAYEESQDVSASVFLMLGIDMEHTQQYISKIKPKSGKMSPAQSKKLRENRAALQRNLSKWCPIQAVYMPQIIAHRLRMETSRKSAMTKSVADDHREESIKATDVDSDTDDDSNEEALDDIFPEIETTTLATKPLGLDTEPEDFELMLPSGLPQALRQHCDAGLISKEGLLRLATMEGELKEIRHLLHVKSGLFLHKKTNIVGQKGSTKAHQSLKTFERRIQLHVQKYRASWAAMKKLYPREKWDTRYDKLKDEDIRPYTFTEYDYLGSSSSDSEAGSGEDGGWTLSKIRKVSRIKKGTKTGRTLPWEKERALGEGSKRLSWIWMLKALPTSTLAQFPLLAQIVTNVSNEREKEELDALRLEYAKCYARKMRWSEELRLAKEEIRRIPWTLERNAKRWEARGRARNHTVIKNADSTTTTEPLHPNIQSGCLAYALKQAAINRALASKFMAMWRSELNARGESLDSEWPTLGT